QKEIRRDEQQHHQEKPEHLRPKKFHAFSLRCLGRVPPAANWLRRFRKSANRRIASARLSFVDNSKVSTPAWPNAERSSFSRPPAAAAKRFLKTRSWVSTNNCSPVSASRITRSPRSSSSISKGS